MKIPLLPISYILLSTTFTCFNLINGFVVANSPTTKYQAGLIKKSQKSHSNVVLNQQQSPSPSSSTESESEPEEQEQKVGTWNPLRNAVLKLKFTELKYTSPLNYEKRPGTYTCASCNAELFSSVGKYDSGSGWPSFWKTAGENRIRYKKEWDGRVEVQCANCRGHLGHVFPDGPMRMDLPEGELATIPGDDLKTSTESNQYTRLPRYCVNGASLRFNVADRWSR